MVINPANPSYIHPSLLCQGARPLTVISRYSNSFLASAIIPCSNPAGGWTTVTDNVTGDDLLYVVCHEHNRTYDEAPDERITEQDIDQSCGCDYDSQNDTLIPCSNECIIAHLNFRARNDV